MAGTSGGGFCGRLGRGRQALRMAWAGDPRTASAWIGCTAVVAVLPLVAAWVGKAAFHLQPVVDCLAEHLKASGKLFMDETKAPVLDPGRGATKTGYLWAVLRDFNSHDQWHDVVEASRIEGDERGDQVGCVRSFTLRDGNRIREQLLTLEDRKSVV